MPNLPSDASKVDSTPFWRCACSIRISHPELDPIELTESLCVTPTIAQRPGESKVHHGNCASAGYFVVEHGSESPELPSGALSWAEEFFRQNEMKFDALLLKGCQVNVYLAVFSNVLAVGFDLPPMPTISRLGIRVGIEFFSK